MEVYEAIEKRRTIRTYKRGVSEEQLRKIILAGTKAPSSGNRQPWEFIIVDDPEIVDQLAEIKYQQNRKLPPRKGAEPNEVEEKALKQRKYFQNTSIIAICNWTGLPPIIQTGLPPSAWLCIQNMSLAAVAEGLGSGIVTYWEEHKLEVEKALGLPPGCEVTAVMKVGVPGEEEFPEDRAPDGPRRPEFSWLHKNRFSGKPGGKA